MVYGLFNFINIFTGQKLCQKQLLRDGRRGRRLASAAGGYYIRLTAGCPPRLLAGWDSEKVGDGLPDYEIYLEGFVRGGSNIKIRKEGARRDPLIQVRVLQGNSAQQTNSSSVHQSGNYFSGE